MGYVYSSENIKQFSRKFLKDPDYIGFCVSRVGDLVKNKLGHDDLLQFKLALRDCRGDSDIYNLAKKYLRKCGKSVKELDAKFIEYRKEIVDKYYNDTASWDQNGDYDPDTGTTTINRHKFE